MEIPGRIEKVHALFDSQDSWEDRYRELIKLGKGLAIMDEQFKVEKFRIKGCQSQVWLYPEFKEGKVFFHADSDAMLVKGIMALLIEVYNGSTPDEILANPPEFLKQMGISEHLSMNRTNGLASMVKQIQLYATAFKAMGAL
jgi:cysteine desulfuration protein SufE